jgi:ubiquinone biosynthesis protein UbiJ
MDIASAFSAILEDGCNRVLRLDANTLRNLGDLSGKVFCLRVNREGKGEDGPQLYFFPSEGGFQVRHQYQGETHVTITGNPPAFLKLVMGEFTPTLVGSGQMQITGDLELGQRFQTLLKKIDIDWEQELSKYTGDIFARKAGFAARRFRKWTRHAADTMREDFKEVMTEELRVAARQEAVDEFMSGIDRLRADVDRLEKRFGRFKGSLG